LNNGVAGYATTLEEFAYLRNAVIHSLSDERAMATPYAEAVAELKAIRDALLTPPKLIDHFRCKVVTCTSDQRIDIILQQMLEGDFSQIPVYQGSLFIDILNTDTVARWFAAHTKQSSGCIKNEKVGQVLQHAENCGPRYQLVNQRSDVFHGLCLFEDEYRKGRSLNAIIITANGKPHDAPVGILTTYDLPTLQSLVHQPWKRRGN
jgi:CBS domain-containing protein